MRFNDYIVVFGEGREGLDGAGYKRWAEVGAELKPDRLDLIIGNPNLFHRLDTLVTYACKQVNQ
jgi:hypothetical protein